MFVGIVIGAEYDEQQFDGDHLLFIYVHLHVKMSIFRRLGERRVFWDSLICGTFILPWKWGMLLLKEFTFFYGGLIHVFPKTVFSNCIMFSDWFNLPSFSQIASDLIEWPCKDGWTMSSSMMTGERRYTI